MTYGFVRLAMWTFLQWSYLNKIQDKIMSAFSMLTPALTAYFTVILSMSKYQSCFTKLVQNFYGTDFLLNIHRKDQNYKTIYHFIILGAPLVFLINVCINILDIFVWKEADFLNNFYFFMIFCINTFANFEGCVLLMIILNRMKALNIQIQLFNNNKINSVKSKSNLLSNAKINFDEDHLTNMIEAYDKMAENMEHVNYCYGFQVSNKLR